MSTFKENHVNTKSINIEFYCLVHKGILPFHITADM